jgi:predicted GNAT family N-acyltransferase
VRSPAELDEALEVRVRVFCDEQGVARDAEIDGLDGEAVQLIVLDRGSVVATCRLRFSGAEGEREGDTCKLERLAVDKPHRGRGLGAALLAKADEEARREGAAEMLAHAQVQVRELYERAGYEAIDETVFDEDGIDHIKMTRPL